MHQQSEHAHPLVHKHTRTHTRTHTHTPVLPPVLRVKSLPVCVCASVGWLTPSALCEQVCVHVYVCACVCMFARAHMSVWECERELYIVTLPDLGVLNSSATTQEADGQAETDILTCSRAQN